MKNLFYFIDLTFVTNMHREKYIYIYINIGLWNLIWIIWSWNRDGEDCDPWGVSLSSRLDFPQIITLTEHNSHFSFHQRIPILALGFWTFESSNKSPEIPQNHERSRPAIQRFLRALLHDRAHPPNPSPISPIPNPNKRRTVLLQSDIARRLRLALYRDFGGSDALRVPHVLHRLHTDASGHWARLALLLRWLRLQFVRIGPLHSLPRRLPKEWAW